MVTSADEGLLRRLVDQLPGMVAYWDRSMCLVVANSSYCQFVGRRAEELRGLHYPMVLGEAVHQVNLPYLRAALAGNRQVFQRSLSDVRGRTRHVEMSYVPDSVAGQVRGIFALASDVTARVEAQRELDEAQELGGLASWARYVDDDNATWSRNLFRLVQIQPSSEGLEASEGDWAALLASVHPADRGFVAALYEHDGRGHDARYRMIINGEVRHVRSRSRAVLDSSGDVVMVRGTIQDETELTLKADALEVVNQRLADVIAMVGHDLRQPLAVTLMNLDEILEFGDNESRTWRHERLAKAITKGQQLNQMLDDILSMSRLDTGAIVARAISGDLARLVVHALADEPYSTRPEVVVRSSAVVHVDPFHLRQILANLLANADRHGAPPVIVVVEAGDGQARLSVIDRGDGVPENFAPQLFDRFTRPEQTGSAQRSGSGFGLHIVRELVRANGGTIRYQPAVPTGARFEITFPAPSSLQR